MFTGVGGPNNGKMDFGVESSAISFAIYIEPVQSADLDEPCRLLPDGRQHSYLFIEYGLTSRELTGRIVFERCGPRGNLHRLHSTPSEGGRECR